MVRNAIAFLLTMLTLGAATARALAENPAERYQRSYDHEATGQYREALAELARLAPEARSTYVHALRRAWLLYLAADHAGAILAYTTASARAPKAVEPHLGMMLPQMALRRWRALTRTAARVLARVPKNDDARTRLAFALYNLGQFERSRRLYAELLAEHPSKVELRAGLGWCLLRLGKAAAAATEFGEVLALAPKHASAAEGMAALQHVARGR